MPPRRYDIDAAFRHLMPISISFFAIDLRRYVIATYAAAYYLLLFSLFFAISPMLCHAIVYAVYCSTLRLMMLRHAFAADATSLLAILLRYAGELLATRYVITLLCCLLLVFRYYATC